MGNRVDAEFITCFPTIANRLHNSYSRASLSLWLSAILQVRLTALWTDEYFEGPLKNACSLIGKDGLVMVKNSLQAALAPTGTLRVGINYGNPVLAKRDLASGEL